MNSLPLLALALAVCAAPASAQSGPEARIRALINQSGVPITPLASIPVPQAAPSVPAAPAESLVPTGLWATLPPPDAATLAFLSSRIPGLNAGAVHVMPLDALDAMFSAAAARSMSPLDVFTDSAFRGGEAYYLAPETISAIFERYEVHMLTPASGRTKDGRTFAMQGLVAGGGTIDALYDFDQFEFTNPLMPEHRYKLANRVTEVIQGPGDAKVEGAWIRMGFLTPKILRITKLSPTEGRVDTNYGSRIKPVTPIRRR